MADRILRIISGQSWGLPADRNRKLEIQKYKNGDYYAQITIGGHHAEKEVIKQPLAPVMVSKILNVLADIQVPAFPNHHRGCDGGFTEIEVGDSSGKSVFRWWSVPPNGWENLDEYCHNIIHLCGFDSQWDTTDG